MYDPLGVAAFLTEPACVKIQEVYEPCGDYGVYRFRSGGCCFVGTDLIRRGVFLQILQKTGQIERTVDREFADEEAKYKTCVSVALFRLLLFTLFVNRTQV